MINKILATLLFCFISFGSVYAQGIRGRITDVQGDAVPFANIYIPQLSTGTTSNIDGNYELKLPAGNWKILFQYIGYQTQSYDLVIGKTFQDKNVQLITQNYKIPEIKILASGEDPAYCLYHSGSTPLFSRKVYHLVITKRG